MIGWDALVGASPDFHRRAWEMLDVYFPKPAAPDVARPSDRSAAVSCEEAASHRSVISRARSVAAPPRRLAADVCRIHARSPSPWTPVTDVWLVLRRIDCPPRLDLVRRSVSNGPEGLFILIAIGWGASPKSVNAQGDRLFLAVARVSHCKAGGGEDCLAVPCAVV